MNLKNFFLEHCEFEDYEINQNQIKIIDDLKKYYIENFNQNLIAKFFNRLIVYLNNVFVVDFSCMINKIWIAL